MAHSRLHRSLVLSPLLSFVFLLALAAAPSANAQIQPNNEFGVWAAYSFGSPDLYGSVSHQQLGVAASRYGRLIHAARIVAIEYTVDVEPVEISRQFKYVPCQTGSGGGTSSDYCTDGHEWVYGGGISPIGWKFNFLPEHRWQPLFGTTGGLVFSVRPVPKDVPLGTQFNFTFDFQFGVEHFNSSRTRAWTIAYKFQHISNASRSVVNPGVDLNMITLGYSFFK